MKQTYLLLFFIFLVLGCSPEKNSDDTANTDDTSNTDDDTNPPDEPTLRLWKEEFEFVDDPSSHAIIEYVYDEEGKLEKNTSEYNNKTYTNLEYEYDATGKLIKKIYSQSDFVVNYFYDSNGNIISNSGGVYEWAAEFDYDNEGRLIELRRIYESGTVYCSQEFFYDNDSLPYETIFDCQKNNHYTFEWDDKKNPYSVAYTEAYCKTNFTQQHNLVTMNIGDFSPYTVHYNITYNEYDFPIEIKVFYDKTHNHTYRYQYQEVD